MIAVSSATDIDAPAHDVWKVLTDLPAFGSWNPFIRKASGSTELGGTVNVRVRPSLPLPLRLGFSAKIIERQDERSLRWRGHVLAPWFASGDHTFALEPLVGGGTHFVQREEFSGLLPWLARKLLAREAQRGFDRMNRALADRAAMEEP